MGATPDSQGGYNDYLELLKLYDKNSNGTMMLAELDNILCNLGDEVPKDDVQKLFAELCDPEDEDGLFPLHVLPGQTDRQGLRCWSPVTCSEHTSHSRPSLHQTIMKISLKLFRFANICKHYKSPQSIW